MAQLGRPFDPSTGLNRRLLRALVRTPGQTPGTLARVLGHDRTVVRDALARLEAYGLVTTEADGTRRQATATTEGRRIANRRDRRSQAVHKAVANTAPAAH